MTALRGTLTNSQEGRGALGFKGEDGLSAYEIAVKNGYQGTEQEWIEHFGLDLTDYIQTTDIVDALNSTATTKPLSAKQGKTLNETIGDLTDLDTTTKTDVVSAVNEVVGNVDTLETYSTTETLIGMWNGEPYYRKIIEFGALPDTTSKSVSTGFAAGDIVIMDFKATANYSSGITLPIPNISDTAAEIIKLSVSSGNITITTGSDRSTATAQVVIEYIKTS